MPPALQVVADLHAIMARQFGNVHDLMSEHQIDLRTATYALAPQGIGGAIEAQGSMSYFAGRETQHKRHACEWEDD